MDSELVESHPGLSPEINRQIHQTLIEGGADLRLLPTGGTIEVQTRNTLYRIERVGNDGETHPFLLSGHPRICPKPRRVAISGSSFGGGMLRMQFVGRAMNLEFSTEEGKPYVTSPIAEVREIQAAGGCRTASDAADGGTRPC